MYTDGTATDRPTPWQQQGECGRLIGRKPVYDAETWFPIGNQGPAVRQIEKAKAICHDLCPVRSVCLDWSLDNNVADGVWGGYSEDERKSMRRRMVRQRRTDPGPRKPPPPSHEMRPDQFVEAGPTRALLAAAVEAGFSPRDISRRTGIGESTVQQILSTNQASVTKRTELAVLASPWVGVSA